jgi:ABC-type phosphate transport system substrate-binding protein
MITNYFKSLLGILALCVASVVLAEDAPTVVVNSVTNPKAFLSKSALSAIFGMRLRKWEDGSPIKVFVLPDDDPLHIAFSKYVLRVFPYQLRSAWDRLVFSGTGEEPIKVKSEQQMRTVVGSTPGAIGYLSKSMIDGTVKAVSLE